MFSTHPRVHESDLKDCGNWPITNNVWRTKSIVVVTQGTNLVSMEMAAAAFLRKVRTLTHPAAGAAGETLSFLLAEVFR